MGGWGASWNGTQPSNTACWESHYLGHGGAGGGSASGTRHLSWLPESRWPPPRLLASADAVSARSALPIAGPTRLGHSKTCLLGHCAQPRISPCVSCSFHLTFALPACRRPADGLYLARFQNVHRKGVWET